eukprot:TRINITY_DN16099_c0_g1_i1.p2 TRINITY_DN16099_c0_g1~~TRINITY_DN16099_c0_g1_i1.p2  ORF type:complete len:101 (+),score=2.06 TRINITY_DN16099_c0_g1_i1:170-472(+)
MQSSLACHCVWRFVGEGGLAGGSERLAERCGEMTCFDDIPVGCSGRGCAPRCCGPGRICAGNGGRKEGLVRWSGYLLCTASASDGCLVACDALVGCKRAD